jgi:CheY-like chemotaxis protein
VSESRSKVLLVEDSKFLRIVNGRALAKAGYDVSTAEDGEQALRVANDTLPDVILLDMMIPKLSGPDVLKALKSNPTTMAIPVIVLSSLSQKNEEKLKELGAAEYFEKGALDLERHPDRLATAVESVLRRRRQRR